MRLNLSVVTRVAASAFLALAALLGIAVVLMNRSISSEQRATDQRAEFRQLGLDLARASDFLTDEARKFAVTADDAHQQAYWNEINVTKTRDHVIERLSDYLETHNGVMLARA